MDSKNCHGSCGALRQRVRGVSIRLVVLLVAALVVWHAPPQTVLGGSEIEVTDFRGKSISLKAPGSRIVCLIESALSGLYMLGAEEQVIGLSSNVYQMPVYPYYAFMDPRVRAKQLPTPGNWDFVNIEMVVGLEPDLVVIWSHQQESIAALEEKGIPVYGVYIEQLEDIYKELKDLGRLTGKGKRADSVIGFAKQKLAEIREGIRQMPETQRAAVYYMWAQGELETAGRNSMVQELIQLSGARNVAGHIQQEHLVVNMENILTWNPDVIVMWYNERKDPKDIAKKAVWRSVSAVKNGQVYEFPDVFTCDLWTLKYIHAVSLVAEWCYPEHFDKTGRSREKWELLERLYGRPFDAGAIENLLSDSHRP